MSLLRLAALLSWAFLSLLSLRAAEPLRVVALHSVMGEFVVRIGGADVAVKELVPGGSDFHSYSPSPSDMRALIAAELILANGFDLEPYLVRLVQGSGTRARLLEASSLVRRPVVLEKGAAPACTHPGHDHHGHAHEGHGERDPHWWHGLNEAHEVATGICEALCELRPSEAAAFRGRLATVLAELAELSRWSREALVVLPPERRHLVTSHDAFAYLAREHGFQVHPISGVNPDSEADARSLARLVDFVSENKIRAIFADNTENPRVLAAMTRETGAVLGGTLFADGLGAPGGPAASHAAMYRHNVSVIVSGLSGSTPASP